MNHRVLPHISMSFYKLREKIDGTRGKAVSVALSGNKKNEKT